MHERIYRNTSASPAGGSPEGLKTRLPEAIRGATALGLLAAALVGVFSHQLGPAAGEGLPLGVGALGFALGGYLSFHEGPGKR